jgi:restriction system protein
MPVPTYDRFIEPILRFLLLHPDGIPAKEAHEAAASALGPSDADKQALVPSGTQPIYKNRAGWAHDRLKRAGMSSSPRRGFWKPTSKGIAFIAEHPAPLSPEVVENLAFGFLDVKLKSISSAPPDSASVAIASPDDRLGQALAELREAAADEALELLANVAPSFFETIVLDVLHEMGYGASREDLQRVGGSGDGGIDGVISLDRLGFERVYVQAKRWQGSVGRPELQAFYGALAGQKARKGVFITTSSFSSQAVEFAKSVEGIVLIDGDRLAQLMIEYEIGIASRTIKVPKIDSDYFEQDAT